MVFNSPVAMDMTDSIFAGTWSDSQDNAIYVDRYMDWHGSTNIQAQLSNRNRKDIFLQIWWSPESSTWYCGKGKLDASGCSASRLVWQFPDGTASVWSRQDLKFKSEQVFFDRADPTSCSVSPIALLLEDYDDLDSDTDSDDSSIEASVPFAKKSSSSSSASSTTVNAEDDIASDSDESVSWVMAARDFVDVPPNLDNIRPPPGLERLSS